MKGNKNISFLIKKGLTARTLGTLNESQIKVLVEKFKRSEKEETKEEWQKNVSQETTYTAPLTSAAKGLAVPPPTDPKKRTMVSIEGGNIKVTQAESSEMTEEDDVDNVTSSDALGKDALQNYTGQEAPHMASDMAPDGMDDDSDTDRSNMGMAESELNEKFESKAQQGLFWARCNKCSSKRCKWCKMAKEFSKSTSKKQYKKMPKKKHPEKTVKRKTNENLQKFLEEKITQMVESEISAKMSKKDLIETIKKKTKSSKSMIIRRPKKLTMFSDEDPMELPIGKMYSIGKK